MTKWTPGGEALTELVLAIFRVNGSLLSEGDRIAGRFDQSSARWQVLGAIADGPQTVPDIARDMGLARQSVQRTADLLDAEGLVEYRDNPAHRRSKLVAMRPRGRRVYAAISAEQADWVNRLSAEMGVSIQGVRKAFNILERLRIAIEGKVDERVAR
jgi:DNA-binding MarR family transcriptional regulator